MLKKVNTATMDRLIKAIVKIPEDKIVTKTPRQKAYSFSYGMNGVLFALLYNRAS